MLKGRESFPSIVIGVLEMYLSGKKRFDILKRDDFTCQYCGKKAPEVELQLDHVIPLAKGGKTVEDNLIISCSVCNKGKGDVGLEESEEDKYIISPDYFADTDAKSRAVKFWSESKGSAGQATIDANYLKVVEWREHPERYFSEVLGLTAWTDPEYDDQVDIANAVRDFDRVSVKSGNGIGKTVIAGGIAHWFLECHYPSIVITTAPTHRQVEKLLWGEIRRLYKTSKIPLGGELLTTELRMEEGWYAIGFSTDDKSKFQGFHSPNILVIVDEAGGMTEDIMEAIEGLLTNEGAKLLLIGNPTNAASYFGRTHLHPRERVLWKNLSISCWNTPNVRAGKNIVPGLCGSNWPAQRKRVWGENHPFYIVRVMGEFPLEGERNLIPYHMVDAALERNIRPVGQKVISVDPARFGDDKSIIGRLWGEQFRVLKKLRKVDGPTLADRVIDKVVEEGGDVSRIKVDEIGEGASCYDALRFKRRSGTDRQKKALKDVKIIPIRFSEKCRTPDGKKNYANIRGETGFVLRDMFENGLIDIDDEDLGAQATTIYYDYEKSGRILLEDKKEFKKRYRSSPDEFDCLLVAKASEKSVPKVF